MQMSNTLDLISRDRNGLSARDTTRFYLLSGSNITRSMYVHVARNFRETKHGSRHMSNDENFYSAVKTRNSSEKYQPRASRVIMRIATLSIIITRVIVVIKNRIPRAKCSYGNAARVTAQVYTH